MFVHVATLYSVRPEVAENFIYFVRLGDWQRIARLVAPDLIAYDLLQHQSSPTPLFLCIDFWVSREKYLRARESGVYDHLLNMRSRLAAATIDLGSFMFPTPAEPDAGIPQIARSFYWNRVSGIAMKTPNPFQSALYLDLEMNCPDRSTPGVGAPEIIEVGIVEFDVVSLEIIREGQSSRPASTRNQSPLHTDHRSHRRRLQGRKTIQGGYCRHRRPMACKADRHCVGG